MQKPDIYDHNRIRSLKVTLLVALRKLQNNIFPRGCIVLHHEYWGSLILLILNLVDNILYALIILKWLSLTRKYSIEEILIDENLITRIILRNCIQT